VAPALLWVLLMMWRCPKALAFGRPTETTQSQEHGLLAPILWTAAATALGYAVQVGDGHLHPGAVAPLRWVVGLSAAGALLPRVRLGGSSGETPTVFVLCAMLAYQFGQLLEKPPGIYLTDAGEQGLQPFRYGIVVAAMLCGLIAMRTRWTAGSLPLLALLGVHFALGVWIIHASPDPFIDTYVFQRDSVQALLAGSNPYTITFPNIYKDSAFYAPGISVNGRLQFGFVYPPLSLLMALPGEVLGGDFRYSQLAAMTIAAGCMIVTGAFNRIAALAAALFLFTPRGFFVLEQCWTEPYVICMVCIVVCTALRMPRTFPYAVGLLLVVKQYTLLFLPLVFLLPNGPRSARAAWDFTLRASASAAVVTLPLLLRDPAAFYRSAIILQFNQPFRSDALSFAAIRVAANEAALPEYLPFLLASCAVLLSTWFTPRTAAGFAGAAALVYCLFFAFAKQAFCNYYYLVIGLLCCAIAASTANAPRTGTA
jgi:hypothetical protein